MGLPREQFDFLVSCEHASNAVPETVQLGVSDEVLESHVAWDPGAKEVSLALAERFSAPLFLGEWTRLVADLNRSPTNPEVIPVHAFGVDIPGNVGLSDGEQLRRIKTYHEPYWQSVEAEVGRIMDRDRVACHISVHSFTEVLDGKHRPVDFGFLIDPDHLGELGVSNFLRDDLAAHGLDVRLNEPYDGRWDALTAALRKRYPADQYFGVEIEVSQRHLERIDDLAVGIADAFYKLKA